MTLEAFAHIAEIATTAIAFVGLAFAYAQIRSASHDQREAAASASHDQREATAKDIYRDYLLLAFKHPDLANPEDTPAIIADNKYRWFVSVLLNSCEEILESLPDDKIWKRVMAAELEYHERYLESSKFSSMNEDRGWTLYSKELKQLYKDRDEYLKSTKS